MLSQREYDDGVVLRALALCEQRPSIVGVPTFHSIKHRTSFCQSPTANGGPRRPFSDRRLRKALERLVDAGLAARREAALTGDYWQLTRDGRASVGDRR